MWIYDIYVKSHGARVELLACPNTDMEASHSKMADGFMTLLEVIQTPCGPFNGVTAPDGHTICAVDWSGALVMNLLPSRKMLKDAESINSHNIVEAQCTFCLLKSELSSCSFQGSFTNSQVSLQCCNICWYHNMIFTDLFRLDIQESYWKSERPASSQLSLPVNIPDILASGM